MNAALRSRKRREKVWLQERWGGRFRLEVVIQYAVPQELYAEPVVLWRDFEKQRSDSCAACSLFQHPRAHRLVLN